ETAYMVNEIISILPDLMIDAGIVSPGLQAQFRKYNTDWHGDRDRAFWLQRRAEGAGMLRQTQAAWSGQIPKRRSEAIRHEVARQLLEMALKKTDPIHSQGYRNYQGLLDAAVAITERTDDSALRTEALRRSAFCHAFLFPLGESGVRIAMRQAAQLLPRDK